MREAINDASFTLLQSFACSWSFAAEYNKDGAMLMISDACFANEVEVFEGMFCLFCREDNEDDDEDEEDEDVDGDDDVGNEDGNRELVGY